jgi:hypothetical protein
LVFMSYPPFSHLYSKISKGLRWGAKMAEVNIDSARGLIPTYLRFPTIDL